jgi:hypothetical protein
MTPGRKIGKEDREGRSRRYHWLQMKRRKCRTDRKYRKEVQEGRKEGRPGKKARKESQEGRPGRHVPENGVTVAGFTPFPAALHNCLRNNKNGGGYNKPIK